MRTKAKVPFVVTIESIKLAKSWIAPFISPSEPPILKMDLVKLARLKGGAEAVDSAPIDIYIVLVPSSPNLVEILEGQPSHPGGWLEGHKLRKEVIFCRGFVNRSAIGVGIWRFVEGGEHEGAIRDGGSTSLPSFRSRDGGEILRAAIIHYMATSARLQ
jgi:hypothetical protein